MADTGKNNVTAKTLESLNAALQKQAEFYATIGEKKKAASMLDDIAANRQKVLNDLYLEQVKAQEKGGNLSKNKLKLLEELEKTQKDYNEKVRKENELLEKGVKTRQKLVDLAKILGQQLMLGWKYLQDQDKIIKTTNLNLGMSGVKAEAMRSSFEKSAGFVTRLGGTMADVQGIMQGYADETGRARVMSADMVKDITAIGKGTGLGIEQATKLGAQFEIMGFDAKSTMDYVQGVVDTSERMGVNTTKVLKNVNDNFKRLNTYTFQQGVKGFAQMAMYAEKFKIDIGQALNAADVARTLEGAIDLAANLQVMGGEFAKTDPFEMLFLSRNDPAKYTEKIADMTKGVVSFRKMSDGTFEKFISPADRDRLAAVAKSMGMEASELTQIAERQAEIQKMRQQTAGIGLSKEQQELIEGAAFFDNKSGKFQVKLAGTMRDISTLTTDQADAFVKEKVSLEDRAKQAMTFNETFQATIETLKAALLPMLKGVNVMLTPLAKIADWFSTIAGSGWGGVTVAAVTLLTAGSLWKVVTDKLGDVVKNLVNKKGGEVLSGFMGRSGGDLGGGGGAGTAGSAYTKTGMIRKGAGGLAAGQGVKSLGKGAGFGAAMAGAGAGVGLAASGISKLADSMSKLTDKQAETLASIVHSLSWFMVGAAGAAFGVMALGAAGTAGSLGLLAFGTAILMVGAGIAVAAVGIGFMAKGFAEMFTASKDAGDNMGELVGGLSGLVAVLASATITLPSAIGLSMVLNRMGKNAPALATVGASLEKIKAGLSGSREDYEAIANAIKTISGANLRKHSVISQMSEMMSKPLQVEFVKDGKVSMTNDITLNIDGQKFMQKAYDVSMAIQKHEDARSGKGS